MRTLCAGLCLWAATAAAQDEANRAKRFDELNPGYRERAGSFYEDSYLGPASRSLARSVALERFTAEHASGILKTLIYDFLDRYVAGGGEISRADHGAAMKRAEDALKLRLDDEAAFQRWIEWRDTTDRDLNPLMFLTCAKYALGGLALRLPDGFRKDGWALRVVEDDGLAAPFRRCFPTLPHQVFVFEHPAGGRLELIVFRAGGARDLLAALEKAKDPELRVFWQTPQFLAFEVRQGAVPETLPEQLRRQLVGP